MVFRPFVNTINALFVKICEIVRKGNSVRGRQFSYLLLANGLSLPAGLAINILLTKYLNANGYGNYAFVYAIYNFLIIVLNFGLFQSANRVLVLTKNHTRQREYHGAALVLLAILSAVLLAASFAYAVFDANLKQKGILYFFYFTIPVGFVLLCTKQLETILPADNRIGALASILLFPKVLFSFFILLLFRFNYLSQEEKLVWVWCAYVLSSFIICFGIYWNIKPIFSNLKKRIREIFCYNRKYGFHLYLGAVFALGSGQLSPIILGYFCSDNTSVGFYTMALLFATPLSLIPNTFATVNYRDFAKQKKISSKLLTATIGVTVFALILLWYILPFFISFCYGREYSAVVTLNRIISLALLLYGVADVFNRFLCAHGFGKEIRNGAFAVSIMLLTANCILIPFLNVVGAALSFFLSGIVYLSVMLIYYYKRLHHVQNEK